MTCSYDSDIISTLMFLGIADNKKLNYQAKQLSLRFANMSMDGLYFARSQEGGAIICQPNNKVMARYSHDDNN